MLPHDPALIARCQDLIDQMDATRPSFTHDAQHAFADAMKAQLELHIASMQPAPSPVVPDPE